MIRDYGAGLTIDELIGMKARDIVSITLPNEVGFVSLKNAVQALCDRGYENYSLMELWGNGESVWMGAGPKDVVIAWPSGQIRASQDDTTADG